MAWIKLLLITLVTRNRSSLNSQVLVKRKKMVKRHPNQSHFLSEKTVTYQRARKKHNGTKIIKVTGTENGSTKLIPRPKIKRNNRIKDSKKDPHKESVFLPLLILILGEKIIPDFGSFFITILQIFIVHLA